MASRWTIVIACWLVIGADGPLFSTSVAEDVAAVLFAQYAGGHFDEASRGLAVVRDWPAFVQNAKRDSRNWPPTLGAAFLLEASCSAVADREPRVPLVVDTDLLKTAEDAVRAPAVSPGFRRTWYLTAIACRERVTYIELPLLYDSSLEWAKLMQQLSKLMPGDPQIEVANIRLQERRLTYFWLGYAATKATNPNPTSLWEGRAVAEAQKLMTELSQQFEHLVNTPSVAAEAAVRAGFWRMMADDQDGALTLFKKGSSVASANADRRYGYLAALFSGRALAMLNRHEEAIASLRQALAIWPTADSARSILAAELYAHGAAPGEAARIVTAMVSAPYSDDDPWRAFPLGDGYLWADRLAELRRELVAK